MMCFRLILLTMKLGVRIYDNYIQLGTRVGQGQSHQAPGAAGRRTRRGHLQAARLGRVATALLGLSDSGDSLSRLRPAA